VAPRLHAAVGDDTGHGAGDFRITVPDHVLERLPVKHLPDVGRREAVRGVEVVVAEGVELAERDLAGLAQGARRLG